MLERYGYRCLSTVCFEDVAGQVLASGADLVLLDLSLPRYDGYHVCREIRRQSQLPIVVVTSRATRMDELMSMNLGADDFITKPYDTQILLARLGRLLERAYPGSAAPTLQARGLRLDLARSTVYYGEGEVELTRNEARILSLLLRRPEGVVSRAELMNELWQGLFKRKKDMDLWMRFIGYSSSLMFALNIVLTLLPEFFFLQIFVAYTFYIIWEGAGPYMGVEEKIRLKFVAITTVVTLLAPAAIQFALSLLMPGMSF